MRLSDLRSPDPFPPKASSRAPHNFPASSSGHFFLGCSSSCYRFSAYLRIHDSFRLAFHVSSVVPVSLNFFVFPEVDRTILLRHELDDPPLRPTHKI